MKLIVITSEKVIDNEAIAINRLFREGMETLHLRKPGASEEVLREMLEQINSDYHNRIVLHDRFELLEHYGLKGVHLNRRNPALPATLPASRRLTVSKSCHSIEELDGTGQYDYVFLSPVFDSISKSGYSKAFTHEGLIAARDSGRIAAHVYALGGISWQEVPCVEGYGFGGVAVLGALWKEFEQDKNEEALLRRFNRLRTECRIEEERKR